MNDNQKLTEAYRKFLEEEKQFKTESNIRMTANEVKEQEINETLEKLETPNSEIKPQNLKTPILIGGAVGILIGAVIMGAAINLLTPTPKYNLTIVQSARSRKPPLHIPLTTQDQWLWFYPVGTNPVVIAWMGLTDPMKKP